MCSQECPHFDLSKREYHLLNRVECSQKKTGEKWMADQEQLDILKQDVKYGTNGEESILLWYLTSVLQT
jgi:hypothetical protein